jgi:hypothetical protein
VLWNHYSHLNKGTEFEQIYNRYPQPLTRQAHLKDLITETQTNLNYSIPNAYNSFKTRDNPNDPSDKVHLQGITFKAFIRRLGNLILEEIYRAGSYDKTLSEFIQDVRGDTMSESSFGSRSSSQSWSGESENNEFGKKVSREFDVSEIKPALSRESFRSSRKNSGSEGSQKNLKFRRKNSESENSLKNQDFQRKSSASDDSRKNRGARSRKSSDSEKSPKHQASRSGSDQEKWKVEKSVEKSLEVPKKEEKKEIRGKVAKNEEEKGKKPPLNKSTNKNDQSLKKVPTKKLNTSTNDSKSSAKIQSKSPLTNSKSKAKNPSISELKDRNSSSSSSKKNSILSLKSSEKAIGEVRQELSNQNIPKDSPGDPLSNFLLGISIENSKKSWFSTEIRGKESEFKSFFSQLNDGKEFLTPKLMPEAFEQSLKRLKVLPHDHHKDWFKNIHEALHPTKMIQKLGSKPKLEIPRISFVDFIEIMNLWGEKYIKEQGTIVGELIRSIDDYKELWEQSKDFKLSENLRELIARLEVILKKYLQSHSNEESLEEKYKKSLEDVFQFYSKVQKIQGTDDTFEALESSNTNLNLGSFLKFCNDFNILLIRGEETRGLSKEVLASIFKKTANNTRLMSFTQFLESLNKISEVFYTPELDKQLNTNFAYLPLVEKRGMLYKQMDLDSFSKYHSKKKAFGISFSPEKYSRIPNNESSQKYKFKITEEDSKKLEEWRKNKNLRESPLPLKPVKEIAKVLVKEVSKVQKDFTRVSHPVIKKSAKNLPSSGYAQRSRMKKGAEVKVEDKEELVEEYQESAQDLEPQPKIITIQALNSLKYHEIDEDFAVRDLIMDESDEFFDKLYGIEPKLMGIMKMHDEKLAKGQKVVEKNKYRGN